MGKRILRLAGTRGLAEAKIRTLRRLLEGR